MDFRRFEFTGSQRLRSTRPWQLAALVILLSTLGGANSWAEAQFLGDLLHKVTGGSKSDADQAPASAAVADPAKPASARGFLNTLKNNLLGQAEREPGSVAALDSRLNKLLSANPPTGAHDPEWPRVAISDIRIPARMLAASKRGTDLGAVAFERDVKQTMAAGDCFYFTATIWADPGHSDLLKSVSLCGADLAKLREAAGGRSTAVDEGKFLTFSTGYTPGETTGHARTTGPTPPKDMIAEKDYSGPAVAKGNGIGAWFVNATAILLGFDPSYDRRRLWFVNFKDV
jgi:hypothetical protein